MKKISIVVLALAAIVLLCSACGANTNIDENTINENAEPMSSANPIALTELETSTEDVFNDDPSTEVATSDSTVVKLYHSDGEPYYHTDAYYKKINCNTLPMLKLDGVIFINAHVYVCTVESKEPDLYPCNYLEVNVSGNPKDFSVTFPETDNYALTSLTNPVPPTSIAVNSLANSDTCILTENENSIEISGFSEGISTIAIDTVGYLKLTTVLEKYEIQGIRFNFI